MNLTSIEGVPHGESLQNVHAVLLTGHWCSVGSLRYDLQAPLIIPNP